MKKAVVVAALVLSALTMVAQTQPAAQGAKDQPKVIKDPGEYNAYMAASSTQDPAQKAAALESFLKQYPATIMLPESLQQLLGAYTAVKNEPKVGETVDRILKQNPDNIQALFLEVQIQRRKNTLESAAAAGTYAKHGLEVLPGWSKPEGVSDADFATAKAQFEEIFDGAAGFAALQAKDYAAAQAFYLKSFQKDPNNLQDIYQFALTDLSMTPIDLAGFWYGAKAIQLAAGNPDTANAANTISRDIKYRYKKVHGTSADWDQFANTTTGQTAPPSADEMAKLIPPPPTPCDFAVEAVKKYTAEGLGFDDKEFVLAHVNCSPANKEAADKVWQAILDKQKAPDGGSMKLKIPVLVISANKNTIQAALSEENQQNKKADLTITLEKPILRPPVAGATVDVVGTITKYDPEPFMFTMEGALAGAKPAPKPASHPVRRGTASQKPA